tara:strand:+ start:47 stop:349 length:303 start_codon:yes stop_codon:yes gene_type:complete
VTVNNNARGKMKKHKETCLRCDGTGRVWFSSFLAGVCFGCKGKGHVLLKKKRVVKKTKTRFKLFMTQDGEPVHCSWGDTKKSVDKWLALPGERWVEEVSA